MTTTNTQAIPKSHFILAQPLSSTPNVSRQPRLGSSLLLVYRRLAAWFNRFFESLVWATFTVHSARGPLLILLMMPWSLGAATLTVTNLADAGPGSLRQIIATSDSNDIITFAVSGTIVLTSGELVISQNLTILGPTTEKLAVSGNNNSRVLNITGGIVNIENLTIRNGRVSAPGVDGRGGGILNQGILNLTSCTISTNFAIGGDSADVPGNASGGGIWNGGTLSLINCTVVENAATAGRIVFGGQQGAGASGEGGGIWNGGTLSLVNCTIAQNWTFGGSGSGAGNGGSSRGAGIASSAPVSPLALFSRCTLVNCTVSRNLAAGGRSGLPPLGTQCGGPFFPPCPRGGDGWGGGVHTAQTIFTVHNTLFSENEANGGSGFGGDGYSIGPDIAGTVDSLGHNLVGKSDGSSGWILSDLTGTVALPLDPLLGPLQDNGGPTPTMALAPMSAAVDAGDDAVVSPPMNLETDQRGFSRWEQAHVDIGAFELPCDGSSLVVQLAGSGRVTWSPVQICYAPGSLVGLWAIPDPGWKFAGWTGDVTNAINPLILTLNHSKWITARFEALPNLVINGSFENTAGTFVQDNYGVMSLPVGSTAIPGWTTTEAEVMWGRNGNFYGVNTPYGVCGLDLTGAHDTLPFGGVTQTITTTLGKKYQFSISLGSNADLPAANGRKEVLVTCGSASTNFSFQSTATTGNEWRDFSFEFEAESMETPITIKGVDAGGVYLGVDNVSVFPPPTIPPPTLISACFGPDGYSFLVGGDADDRFRIEYSEDLRSWGTIQVGVPAGSVLVDTDPARRTARTGYYRAVKED